MALHVVEARAGLYFSITSSPRQHAIPIAPDRYLERFGTLKIEFLGCLPVSPQAVGSADGVMVGQTIHWPRKSKQT